MRVPTWLIYASAQCQQELRWPVYRFLELKNLEAYLAQTGDYVNCLKEIYTLIWT